MPNENDKPTPLAAENEEEIDVTEICERLDVLEKKNIEAEKTIEALGKRLTDCEDSIDAICGE